MKHIVIKDEKIYEFEAQRRDVTPREFFNYVKREFRKRCGQDLATWIDDFDSWREPVQECELRTRDEICYVKPYDRQFYLAGTYNFILEFNFWDDKKGTGYCYIMEIQSE